MLFIVVNGVPSNATWIMVGDGIIGKHTIRPRSQLPGSTIPAQLVAQHGGNLIAQNSSATTGTSASSAAGIRAARMGMAGIVLFILLGIVSSL